MLRITETSKDEKTVTLRLDGRVVDVWISDLKRQCLYYRDKENKTVVIDFSGVTFINSEGIRMLEKIKDERVKIVNEIFSIGV